MSLSLLGLLQVLVQITLLTTVLFNDKFSALQFVQVEAEVRQRLYRNDIVFYSLLLLEMQKSSTSSFVLSID